MIVCEGRYEGCTKQMGITSGIALQQDNKVLHENRSFSDD